jgi:hypothetical protein
MNGSNRSDDELRQLAKSWFSEARQKSAQEETEVNEWFNSHRKWSHLTRYYVGGSSRSGRDDSDGSSGDCGGGD